jgi:hypothetical protein
MNGQQPPISVTRIGRTIFGSATIGSGLVALLLRDDARWFAAAGVFGLLWWSWDLLLDHVFVPLGEWMAQVFTSGVAQGAAPNVRPTLEDTIRLLEGHIRKRASRQVEINAAVRLEEIYRTVKRDPERARDVIARVRERYPDARELERYRSDESGGHVEADFGRDAHRPR